MRKRAAILPAAAIAAAALGPGIVTGRETAGFFSQMAKSSWLGVACAGTIFALLAAGLIRMKECTGAQSLYQLAKRMPNRAGGIAICAFHGMITAFAGLMILAAAWEIGALTLPMRGGGAVGALAALLIAAANLLLPSEAQMRIFAGNLVLVLIFEAVLAVFGKMPAAAGTYVEAELKLAGNNAAAVILGIVHAAMSVCVAANAALRFSRSARPLRTGLLGGGFYAICLAIGNLAIRARADFLTALRLPLAVLAAGWGGAGFRFVTLSAYFASVIVLTAVLLPFCDVKL